MRTGLFAVVALTAYVASVVVPLVLDAGGAALAWVEHVVDRHERLYAKAGCRPCERHRRRLTTGV